MFVFPFSATARFGLDMLKIQITMAAGLLMKRRAVIRNGVPPIANLSKHDVTASLT